MAVGLTVIQHHGPSRTISEFSFPLLLFSTYSDTHNSTIHPKDPEHLRRAHVVITTYPTLASEYLAFSSSSSTPLLPGVKKSKAVVHSDSDSEDGSDAESVGALVKGKGKGKVGSGMKTKTKKDALFRVKWWRIVLGVSSFSLSFLPSFLFCCYCHFCFIFFYLPHPSLSSLLFLKRIDFVLL
jgi:hypothetical protein